MKQFISIAFLVSVALSELCGAQAKNLTMSGSVTDKESRQPLKGARVTIIGNKAISDETTDSKGKFIITFVQGVEEGNTVRIRVEKPGYEPYDEWVPVSSKVPQQISLESVRAKPPSRAPQPAKAATVEEEKKTPPNAEDKQPRQPKQQTTPYYDHAHLAIVNVQLWAALVHSEAMVTVRNVGSKPIVPCTLLRGAIITSPWLSGSVAENQLFAQRPEWQEGGKGQLNCDTDWNPGVDKTYSIQLTVAINDGPNDWTSLMHGEKLWYVVSRLGYRDSDLGPALPEIENCVWFRAEKPEWAIGKCFGHNDPTLGGEWLSGSGREATEPNPTPNH